MEDKKLAEVLTLARCIEIHANGVALEVNNGSEITFVDDKYHMELQV